MTLFWGGVARRVSIILLSLFSPVYIFVSITESGFSYKTTIFLVISFYILEQLAKLVTISASENLSQKMGFKGVMRASALPFILFILLMLFAKNNIILFPLALITIGIHSGFYWWGYHGYFIKTGDEKHFGLSISEAGFLETIAAVATPLAGALITSYFGFGMIFIVAAFFMALAFIFIGKDHDKRQRRDVKFKEIISLIKRLKSISLAYVGSGGEGVIYAVAWPLYLFIIFGQVISMGQIVSLAALFASIFSLAVGQWVDKQGEKTIVRIGSPLVFFSWVIRGIGKSFASFVFADSFWNFGERMVVLPLNALTYKKALEGKSSARAILFREISTYIGALFSLILLLISFVILENLDGVFWTSAFFALFPLIAVFKGKLADK
ncbi:hypothetical protein A2V80_00545 [Candidatus Woesebacteria bacterium RBG_16_39_8b]|uniref:Major facilitator superfamily (MFS) profile domain-containing protein n=1 Tax=Candidatus Woesebacteria bacterium RBG_16_39_8b TaxID=1802482 RepID=A0A1F7XA09_9BACT|nr:MAG: hypothetical protein A2V80_00545 [Candidatus Woesebacteria bacterium RBG_16_39_8b]